MRRCTTSDGLLYASRDAPSPGDAVEAETGKAGAWLQDSTPAIVFRWQGAHGRGPSRVGRTKHPLGWSIHNRMPAPCAGLGYRGSVGMIDSLEE